MNPNAHPLIPASLSGLKTYIIAWYNFFMERELWKTSIKTSISGLKPDMI